MRKPLFISLTFFTLYSCCKVACEDQGLQINVRNMQAVDTDTVYMIKYKPNTSFTERIDTVKHFDTLPAGSAFPSTFMEYLDYTADWKVVIPALNKEYFISNFEIETDRCACNNDKYRRVKKFRLNNTEREGSALLLD